MARRMVQMTPHCLNQTLCSTKFQSKKLMENTAKNTTKKVTKKQIIKKVPIAKYNKKSLEA